MRMKFLTRYIRRYAILLPFIAAGLLFFPLRYGQTMPWVQLRNITTTLLVSPIAFARKTSVEWKSFLLAYRDVVQGGQELNRLQMENTRQALEILQLRRKLEGMSWDENLRASLPPLPDYHLLPAEIVFRSPSRWLSRAIINRGTAQGVKTRSAVISSEGVVGKIQKVYPNYSILHFFIDSGFVMGGKVSRTGEVKVLEGKGTYAMLQYFPLKSDIRVGDVVLTSGQDGIFPPGLFVGSVFFIQEIPGRALLEVRVMPGMQFTRLERVMILVPEKEVLEVP